MNQKHVPDLELCQTLDTLCKEKNITLPETEFYYKRFSPHSKNYDLCDDGDEQCIHSDNKKIPAPLVSELGEWLPWSIDTGCVNFDNCPSWHRVTYYRGEHYLEQTASTEANARQKMINYLIAEGIITTL